MTHDGINGRILPEPPLDFALYAQQFRRTSKFFIHIGVAIKLHHVAAVRQNRSFEYQSVTRYNGALETSLIGTRQVVNVTLSRRIVSGFER